MPDNPLLGDSLRVPVEQLISEHIGRDWPAREAIDLRDYACHPAAILSDGEYAVFAKYSDAANGLEQFEIELAGLRMLAERAGVLIPSPIGIITLDGGALLVMEAVRSVERGPCEWRQIGQALARIHQVKGEHFGLETQGYIGPLYQDNRPLDSWAGFFSERRLWPRLAGAVNSGNLPSAVIRQVEKLIVRFPQLCGPEPIPTLLHGDAQQNNYISSALGAVVIDPAVYYGNPELDLAFMDYFQPVPQDVFWGYQEILPIDPGFAERRELYRVYGYLAAVEVEGTAHLGKLTRALEKYVP
jgi:fructosamine-3-kinase